MIFSQRIIRENYESIWYSLINYSSLIFVLNYTAFMYIKSQGTKI